MAFVRSSNDFIGMKIIVLRRRALHVQRKYGNVNAVNFSDVPGQW